MLHLLRTFRPSRSQLHRAVCGAIVTLSNYSEAPDCKGCLVWLHAERQRTLEVELPGQNLRRLLQLTEAQS